MENIQIEQRGFIDIENDLKLLLNSKGKASFNKADRVLNLLREMVLFKAYCGIKGFKISKEYLKSLYENTQKRRKTDNLNTLLKAINNYYVTNTENKYFNEMVLKTFHTQALNNISKGVKYYKSFKVGKFYKLSNKKAFNFLLLNCDARIQKAKQLREMQLRALNLFPEFSLKYIFDFEQ